MAKKKPNKVVITVEDADLVAGKVNVHMEFGRAMKPSDPMTPALAMAMRMFRLAAKSASKDSSDEL